jgi:hypothetical protein
MARWLLLEGRVDVPYLEGILLRGNTMDLITRAWDNLTMEDREIALRLLWKLPVDRSKCSTLKEAGFACSYLGPSMGLTSDAWEYLHRRYPVKP